MIVAGRQDTTQMKKQPSRHALEMIAAHFRVLGDASRLNLLLQLSSGEKTVQGLCQITGMSQANASKHLNLLAEHGLVRKRREGLFVYYTATDRSVYELCDLAHGALGKRFNTLARQLSN